jgi:hypothetical protein
MIVYKPMPEDRAQFVIPQPPEAGYLQNLGGQPQLPKWKPETVSLLKKARGGRLVPVDLPCVLAEGLALNTRAKDVLVEVVGHDAELLPLACEDEPLWLLNPLHVSDALDEKRSEFARYPSSGRIMDIVRPAFDRKKLGNHRYFLTRQKRYLYVTDVVVQAVRAAKLTGVRFEQVWSDEAP